MLCDRLAMSSYIRLIYLLLHFGVSTLRGIEHEDMKILYCRRISIIRNTELFTAVRRRCPA